MESCMIGLFKTEHSHSGAIAWVPDEWLATFADPMRAQSAIDRSTSNAYELVLDGESYRQRLKPGRDRAPAMEGQRPTKKK